MRTFHRLGRAGLVFCACVLGASCGDSEGDSSAGHSSGGSAGVGGGQQYPGCTKNPDCASCATCIDDCVCKTGFTPADCAPACGSATGGAGGSGATGTGGSGGTAPGGTGGVGGTAPGGTGGTGVGGTGGASGIDDCFKDIFGPGALVVPNYAQFNPQVGPSCSGTNHQDIQGVEKVVFLGDSITAMDYAIFPPLTASPNMIYRKQMSEKLTQKFPGVEIVECSKDGARNDDFLAGGNQIGECFPTGVEPKKTLILITMGGNDLRPWAEQKMSPQQYQPLLDTMLAQIREAIVWLKDPVHFPNGSFVIFANVYEFTDTSTDMGSCPGAAILGLSGTWQTGAAALIGIAEGYMKIAVDTQSDMVFMMETFCGHGYKKDDPNLQCYRGPGAELYFDPTCIHPSDAGATALANLFFNVVNE